MAFHEMRPELMTDNPFKLIGAGGMPLTAGTQCHDHHRMHVGEIVTRLVKEG